MPNHQKQIVCINCENILMKKIKIGNKLELDQCPQCGGVWFDGREMITLLELGESFITQLDDPARLTVLINTVRECPNCHLNLDPVNYQGTSIRVDRCKSCKGMWFDRGELARFAETLKEE